MSEAFQLSDVSFYFGDTGFKRLNDSLSMARARRQDCRYQPAAHVATTERRIDLKNVLGCGRKDASNRPFCDSIRVMGDGLESLPDDIETLKAALIVARAEAAAARALQSDNQALIAHLKLQIEKLNRDRYGPRSERTARLLDQLELTLEELESSATKDELAAEMAAAKEGGIVCPQAAVTPAVPGASASRPALRPGS